MSSGQFELKNGNLFVLAEAAGGVYNGSQLRLICDVVDDVSVFLKVTEDQRIGFMVPKDKLLELHAKLAKSGILLKHYRNHSILSPKACLGELCPKCEQDALGDAIEISPHLNEKFKESFVALNIGMNGCATACVASATDDIHVIGEKSGYKILIGGRSAGEVKVAEFLIDSVPKEKIGESICAVLETYSQNKQENESLADIVTRVGLGPFKQALQTIGIGQASAEETNNSTESPVIADEDIAAVPLNEAALEEKLEAAAPAEEAAAPAEEAAAPAEEAVAPAEEAAAPAEEAAAPAEEAAAPAEEAAAPAEEEISIETESAAQPSSVAADEETIDFAAENNSIQTSETQENANSAASAVSEEAPLEISDNSENISETAAVSQEGEQTETLVENSENTEESPLEVDESSDANLTVESGSAETSETAETPPLEMAGSDSDVQSEETTNTEMSETEAVEEPPLEIAGAEATPSAIANESATEEPPMQEANLSEDQASVGEEVMKDEEIPAAETAPTEISETPVDTAAGQEQEQTAEASPEATPAVEMKELDIVDDTAESADPPATESADADIKVATPEELTSDSPQPIDHGLGEDTTVSNIAPTQNMNSDSSGEIAEETAPIGLDDDVKPTNSLTGTNKTSIQVRGKYFMVILSDGSDFRIPFRTIQVGKVLEMQIEDEVFIVENIDGKLQVKYGDFEMHVPLSHGSESEDTTEGAA